MMKNGLGLFLCIALACAGSAASAQPTFTQQLEDLLSEVPSPKGDPLWSGSGGFKRAESASAKRYAGDQKAGATFFEVAITYERSGHIASAITLTDPKHGQLDIPAGARVHASETGQLAIMGHKQEYRPTGVDWCLVSPLDDPRICISGYTTNGARYAETTSVEGGIRETRSWFGPRPAITPGPVTLDAPMIRRWRIGKVTATGFTMRQDLIRGDREFEGRETGVIPFGQGIVDHDLGVAFTPMRGKAKDSVNIRFDPLPERGHKP